MGRDKKRRAVELVKDVLIVLLTCSALWLAAQTQLLGPLSGLFQEEDTLASPGQSPEGNRAEAALPMAMAVNLSIMTDLPGDSDLPAEEMVRYGVQYDQAACQELFQQVASTLVETLSSAGAPERIDRAGWEEALGVLPGIYMDFHGEIPMPVLTGWLSGEGSRLDATVRRLVLAVGQEGLDLYYRNEEDGGYYRCQSEVSLPLSLSDLMSGLTGNGAFYAFESELYGDLDPDTLLFSASPAPRVYTAANPVGDGQESLEEVIGDLGISRSSMNFYSAEEQVARNEDESVRLYDHGVVLYQAGESGGRFQVAGAAKGNALFQSVELCRQLAMDTLGARCGDARIYLLSVAETAEGWEIEFNYSLNGIPVHLEQGYAARFLVEGERVTQFTLNFRSYTASDTTSFVLPLKQATAALAARGLQGEELLLVYPDSGGDTLSAGWVARDDRAGEG